MQDKLTRRQMAIALAGSTAALGPPTASAQQAAGTDRLAAARGATAKSIERLEEFDLPMEAEPAFIFEP